MNGKKNWLETIKQTNGNRKIPVRIVLRKILSVVAFTGKLYHKERETYKVKSHSELAVKLLDKPRSYIKE